MNKDLQQRLTQMRTQHLKLLKLRAELKDAEEAYEREAESLREQMTQQGLTNVSVKGVNARLVETELPKVTNWDALYAFIRRKAAFYLLHKRVSSTAWKELKETMRNKTVPGTETFVKTDVKLQFT